MNAFSSKHIALKVDVIGPENLLFAGRHVRAVFSPEIVQAGAGVGLIIIKIIIIIIASFLRIL